MLATRITTHLADATSRLLAQYQGLPLITGLLQALCGDIQNIENALYAIDTGRQVIGNPYGEQLDNLGTLIDTPRNGLADAPYLSLILGTIAEDNSDGTAAALVNIAKTLYEATAVFLKTPNSPGQEPESRAAVVALGIGSPQAPFASWGLIQNLISHSISAGVGLYYISRFNASGSFAMAGSAAWTNNGVPRAGTGFGSVNSAVPGGNFAGILYNNSGL